LACNRCGLRKCAFVKHVAVQQVVAYPQVSYFVGAPIRVEALVQQALRTDPDYEAFQKFRQWQSMTDASRVATAPPAGQGTQESSDTSPEPAPLLAQSCSKCHSGATPKAGLIIDGHTPLTAEQALHAMRRIQAGEMPPKVLLSPEEAGAAFSELLELSKPEAEK
jgi:hypothetical protein